MFAQRYLDACAGWHAGTPIPDAWRLAFESAADGRYLASQHLLLGIKHPHWSGRSSATATSLGPVN